MFMTDEEELEAIRVAVPNALKAAREEAMKLNGRVLEAQDGWLVYEYADGKSKAALANVVIAPV